MASRIIILIIASVVSSFAQVTRNIKREAVQLKEVLVKYHFAPAKIDDIFSKKVFENVIDELDPERLYFSQEELKLLLPYKHKLDDEINGPSWAFYPQLLNIYKNAFQALNSEWQATQSVIEVNAAEIIKFDTLHSLDQKARAKRFANHIKIQILEGLADYRFAHANISDVDLFLKIQPQVRDVVVKRNLKSIQKILNHPTGFDNYVANVFLKSIGYAFDPHSVYFSPTQMQNFISFLSTEGYYFGLGVAENDRGQIMISNLMPGGPAWKSGEIHVGDIIEKVKWEGSDWVDIHGMSQDEVDDLLIEFNDRKLELSLQKAGGILKTVQLKKEKMNSDEDAVRSFILSGTHKIGYIVLPDFYSQWGESEGARCANDVAKEILKLKKENIEGLILDVRYNGGGSLSEAVAMAGIFIDAGPMGIIHDKGEAPLTVKDINRGTVYDGPLVLMVNGLSASASEFLAAALKDYRRAVVVGSKTYGKATGQQMYSLEPNHPEVNYASLNTKNGWGYSTITTSKIYRITGNSIQRRGIVPDIIIPDLYDFYDKKESSYRYAIQADSIFKKTYYESLPLLPIPELKEKSSNRINKEISFAAMRNYHGKLNEHASPGRPTYTWPEIMANVAGVNNSFGEFEKSLQQIEHVYSIDNSSLNQARLMVDKYAEDIYKAWSKNLLQDVSLQEAYKITSDFIDIINRK